MVGSASCVPIPVGYEEGKITKVDISKDQTLNIPQGYAVAFLLGEEVRQIRSISKRDVDTELYVPTEYTPDKSYHGRLTISDDAVDCLDGEDFSVTFPYPVVLFDETYSLSKEGNLNISLDIPMSTTVAQVRKIKYIVRLDKEVKRTHFSASYTHYIIELRAFIFDTAISKQVGTIVIVAEGELWQSPLPITFPIMVFPLEISLIEETACKEMARQLIKLFSIDR